MDFNKGVTDSKGSTSGSDAGSSGGKKNNSNGVLWLLSRFWYVVLVLVVVVGGLVVWSVQMRAVDDVWKKAADDYGKADYEAASKLIEDMPIPSDEKRLTMYAQTMLATRQHDKALPAYEKLYAMKKDPAVKIIIGNIYNEQKKYDEAAKTYGSIISSNASFIQAYVNLATLYKLQGKTEDSVRVARQGVEANPNSVTLYELLVSMLLEDKTSAEYKDAVAKLKKLNPSDPLLESLKNK